MSLRVWFPLNGDLNNQGLSGTTATASGSAAINNNGKIGQCYSFGTNTGYIQFTPETVSTFKQDFSFSMWFNITNWNTSYSTLLYCGPGTAAWAGYIFGLLRNGSNSNLVFVISNGTTATNASLTSSTISLNTWYHIACTYSAGKMKIYLNGTLDKEFATTIKPNYSAIANCFIGAQASGTYQTNALINDVRIYDHCLSMKEIQELSRGLVAHYLLNNGTLGASNLITKMTAGGRTTLIDAYNLEANFGANADTYFYFNVSPSMALNKTYTISFDVENFPENGTWSWYLFKQGATAYTYYITGNGHHKWTFTTDPNTLPSGYTLNNFIADDGGRGNPAGIVKFSNFKLEEGNTDSTWCPHVNDTNYAGYFDSNTREADCSGFGYHATKEGSFTYSSDTACNNCSTIFNGSTTSIALPIKNLMNNLLKDKCTINFWCKEHNTASRSVYFGGYPNSPFNIEMTGSKFRVYWGGTPDIQTSSVSNNVWTMWSIVVDKATGIKLYKDKELVYTHSGALVNLTCNSDFWLGKDDRTGDTMFEGAMVDFRIYATALTTDDIKELYQVPATIDRDGNLYSKSYQLPGDKHVIYRKGIVDCSLWENYQSLNFIKNKLAFNENLINNSAGFTLDGSDYSSLSTRSLGKVAISSDSYGNAYRWLHSSVEGNMASIFASTKTMTFSLDVKVANATKTDASASVTIDYRKSDSSNKITVEQDFVLDGQWHRYYLPITANNQGQTRSLICLRFSNLNGATIYYKNLKYEEGDMGTPWCPSASEGFTIDNTSQRAFISANQFYEV